ncbi:MAG: hypothetical protein HQK54_06110 [Oligoflexales bacterium]|nr:hypothetical protein [Oligoflexales bacterium]
MNIKTNKFKAIYFTVSFLQFLLFLIGCGQQAPTFQSAQQTQTLTPEEAASLQRTVVQSFTAGDIKTSEISKTPKINLVEQKIQLRQREKSFESFKQIGRPIKSLQFTQGFDGYLETQEFKIQSQAKLDLLFVIDSSNSMSSFQNKLAASLNPILQYISNTDWQIAVVTMDPTPRASDGKKFCLRDTNNGKGGGIKFLTKKDFDTDQAATRANFSTLVNAGTTGSTDEEGIQAAGNAIVGDCGDPKKDWKRVGANTAIFIMSDEKNCGSEGDESCGGAEWAKSEYVISRAPASTKVYGLFLLKDNPELCPNSGQYYPGQPEKQYPKEYVKLVESTGGVFGEICQTDYTETLSKVSESISNNYTYSFELNHVPQNGKVRLVLDGNELNSGYKISGNLLTITDKLPVAAETLEISYHHDAVEKTSSFALPRNIDPETLSIKINETPVNAAEYTYDSQTYTIHFFSTPADLTKILVEYREKQELPKTYNLSGRGVIPESVEVKVNGKQAGLLEYDQVQNRVTLVDSPKDLDEIQVFYSVPEDKTIRYKIEGTVPSQIELYSFVDEKTSAAIQGEINEDSVVFKHGDVYDGRIIIGKYTLLPEQKDLDFSVPLVADPLENSISIMADDDPTLCSGNMEVARGEITFSCLNNHFTTVVLKYSYCDNYTNVFTFQGVYREGFEWKVYVDDREITTFTRVERTITIPIQYLPVGAKVKISRSPLFEQN